MKMTRMTGTKVSLSYKGGGMRKTAIFLMMAMLLSTVISAAQISFYDNFDEAVKDAGEQNKKILITFKSPT